MTFAQRLFGSIKAMLSNHKKKFIALALLGLVVYYIKNRMTVQTMMAIAEKLLKFAQYLPLPQPPVYRQVLPIGKAEPQPYLCLKNFIDIEDIKNRIKNKELNQWDQLKEKVLAGFAFSVTLFDITEITNIIKSKYQQQFIHFDALQPFNRALALIQKNFMETLSLYYDYMRANIRSIVQRVDVTEEYTKERLYGLLTEIVDQIWTKTYDSSKEMRTKKSRETVDPQVQRLFYTQLATEQKKPGIISGFISSIFGVFSILSTDVEFQPTNMRFEAVKQMFSLDFGLSSRLQSQFKLNSKEQELFQLVFREFQDLIESLNLHTLIYNYSKYQTARFINRLELFMVSKKQEKIKISASLSVIYKIILEEYLNQDSWNKNKAFLTGQIKQSFRLLHTDKEQPNLEDIRTKSALLHELQLQRRIDLAKNEFLLKNYHQRSGIDATKAPQANMDFQAKEMLAFLSKDN